MNECVEFGPSRDLTGIIECLWSAVPSQDFDCEIAPDGSLELCFILSEAHPDTLLFGPATRHSTFRMKKGIPYLGARFRPGIGSSLLRENASALTDCAVSIRGIEAFSAGRLLEFNDSNQRRIQVESAVRSFFGQLQLQTANCVSRAIEMIERSRGNIRIQSVAKVCGVSQKQLERYFLQDVGIVPKFYARLVRIHSAVDYMKAHPAESGASVAALHGFTDQSHMIRELRALSTSADSISAL